MKLFHRIKEFLVTGLLVIMLILYALWAFIKTPYHYFTYKRSDYYRDFRRKYTLFICTTPNYRMYNLIKKHNLPIQFLFSDPKDPTGTGYFVYKHTLILHELSQVEYREDIQRWVFHQSKGNLDEPTPIFDYAMGSLSAVNEIPNHKECTHMLLLINRKQVAKKDLARAERDTRFLMHNGKDLGDLLEAYIITHPKG